MSFLELLSNSKIVLLDGGMGSQLVAMGLEPGADRTLDHPDAVESVHRLYADAGAQIVISNTFSSNRIYLNEEKGSERIRNMIAGSVKLARQAVPEGVLIAGDIGPTGQFLEPYGNLTEEEMTDVFTEQAELLNGEGVALFVVETMTAPKEAACAIRACKSVSELPVLASFSFDLAGDSFRTMMGAAPGDCARAAVDEGADLVGANCGSIAPEEMAKVVAEIKTAVDVPVIAQPNGGRPEVQDGQTVYNLGPEDFATGVKQCVDAGASIIGGCCGTTPDHIRACRDLLIPH